jgi:exo-1,4-beta-D-glucosaminidase
MRLKSSIVLLTALAVNLVAAPARAAEPASAERLLLENHWFIQSSDKVAEDGKILSSVQFKPAGWYPASVPSTVLAALVNDKVYPDPDYGMNLRKIPGTEYPIGENFSNLPMPVSSPFRPPWWYLTRFQVPSAFSGKTVWLHFDGINFRANIWLNGREIADSKQIAGSWRIYELDVTKDVLPGKENALAVEVQAPTPRDLAITFVDWNPLPPDKDMGLWRPVYLTTTGPVALRYPEVITHFDLPSLDTAHLTVLAELRNAASKPVEGTLRARIGTIEFAQHVQLGAGETRTVRFLSAKFPQLNLTHPRLWWPAQVGPQNLYTLEMGFGTSGQISDRQTVHFGVREVTSELTPQGYRLFKINGKNILIRGGGYTFDMLLRSSPEEQENHVRYLRDLNFNSVRLEGKLEDDHFFDLCDRYGIMVLAGWCCCDHWERWNSWQDEDYVIARESLKDQIRRLRSHACLFDWLNGSDNPPPEKVEQMYIGVLKDFDWPNPFQSSASAKPTTVTGESGVKMTGPYEYVAPSYWLDDKEHGGAYGFNTETSPGPAVPPVSSLRKFLPADHLWPMDDYWNYHAGGGEFSNLKVFTEALEARYGKATGVEDFAEKSQVMAYEGERAMFEAYGRNKYVSTGVIQWMLNNAWPSLIWHLYDYYWRPGGSYFGAKKACEPLHIQYAYDDHTVMVVNSFYQGFEKLKAEARVYNLDLAQKLSKDTEFDALPDSSTKLFAIPDLSDLTSTYFLRLELNDSAGKIVSRNFYWLSTKPDVLDWAKSEWYYTPTKSFSDMKTLATLPQVKLIHSSRFERKGDEGITTVTVENPTTKLAFFVHLGVNKPDGEEVLPVLWEDNYFPLFPNEKREVTARYYLRDAGNAAPAVHVDSWNVTPE